MPDVLERDAGFCSGGDEDDMEAEDGIHSPTDASEDSVDVKVQAISLRNKNKRKCAEPRRLDTDLPAKKRKIDLRSDEETKVRGVTNCSPFRPWSRSPPQHVKPPAVSPLPSRTGQGFKAEPCELSSRLCVHPGDDKPQQLSVITLAGSPSPVLPTSRYPQKLLLTPPRIPSAPSFSQARFYETNQEEPLSLVSKKRHETASVEPVSVQPQYRFECASAKPESCVRMPSREFERSLPSTSTWHTPTIEPPHKSLSEELVPNKQSSSRGRTRDPHPRARNSNKQDSDKKQKVKVKNEDISRQSDSKFRIDSLLSVKPETGSPGRSSSPDNFKSKASPSAQQRNYKNMTRERRIEANARERTRVHTISAAFDTLRHSVPAYSHNQKLSKLSVLRIACSYIMTLSRLAGHDYSQDQSEPELADCVDNVSKTIQTEGKIRKKKED